MALHCNVSDCDSQVSRTFLGIQADFNHTVGWMVSIRPLISNSSSPITKPLGIDPSALVITSIPVTSTFHYFISSLASYKYFSLFLFCSIFTLLSVGKTKSTVQLVFSFMPQGLVFKSGLDDPFSKLQRRL